MVKFWVKVVKSLRGILKNLKHSDESGKYSKKFHVNMEKDSDKSLIMFMEI